MVDKGSVIVCIAAHIKSYRKVLRVIYNDESFVDFTAEDISKDAPRRIVPMFVFSVNR